MTKFPTVRHREAVVVWLIFAAFCFPSPADSQTLPVSNQRVLVELEAIADLPAGERMRRELSAYIDHLQAAVDAEGAVAEDQPLSVSAIVRDLRRVLVAPSAAELEQRLSTFVLSLGVVVRSASRRNPRVDTPKPADPVTAQPEDNTSPVAQADSPDEGPVAEDRGAPVDAPSIDATSREIDEDDTEWRSRFESARRVTDPGQRLSAYEAILDEIGIRGPDAPSETGSWQVDVTIDPITDEEKIEFSLYAEEKIGMSNYDSPYLVLRWTEDKSEVFINWSNFIDDDPRVTMRFDGGEPRTSTWNESTSRYATFYRSEPIALIQDIESSDELIVRTSRSDGSTMTVTFSTPGLSGTLAPYSDRLGWHRVVVPYWPFLASASSDHDGNESAWQAMTPDQLTEILEHYPVDAVRTSASTSALHYVAGLNPDPRNIRVLLDAGATVDLRDSFGQTPLMEAVRKNPNAAIAEALLDAGADPNAADGQGDITMTYAAMGRSPEVFDLLIGYGAEIPAWSSGGKTLLMIAAQSNPYPESLEWLIERGAELDAVDSLGWNALMHAARFSEDERIPILLVQAGIDVRQRATGGRFSGENALKIMQANSALAESEAYEFLDDRLD